MPLRSTALAAILVLAPVTACSQDNAAIDRKLDQLSLQISALDAKLARLPGGAAGQQPQRPRRPEPDPRSVMAVPIAGYPAIGKADAPVTVVEGYEYACPACNTARPVVAQLREKYGDKLRIVYKQYLVHPDVATNAALAVCAAHKQDKFVAMDKVLWEKGYTGGRDFSQAKIEAFATEAGLDVAQFKTDVAGACRQAVAREHGEQQMVGQGGTPTFFVNGRYLVGASPVKLGALIDEELALAEKRIGEGTPAAEYYKTWVLEKGVKKFVPPTTSG